MKKILSLIFKISVIFLLILLYFKINKLGILLMPKKNNLTKEEKYYNLNRVSTSVQIDYIKKYLGVPVFIYQIKNKNKKEYVFTDPDYYVDVITDSDEAVQAYAITTRSKDFNPLLKITGVKVQLGKTTFYNFGKKPDDCEAIPGNTAPSTYAEKYNGWNGTAYQDYLVGYNDAGYGPGEYKIIWETQPTEDEILKGETKLQDGLNCRLPSDASRKRYAINTFGAGFGDALTIGVNRRQVELIN